MAQALALARGPAGSPRRTPPITQQGPRLPCQPSGGVRGTRSLGPKSTPAPWITPTRSRGQRTALLVQREPVGPRLLPLGSREAVPSPVGSPQYNHRQWTTCAQGHYSTSTIERATESDYGEITPTLDFAGGRVGRNALCDLAAPRLAHQLRHPEAVAPASQSANQLASASTSDRRVASGRRPLSPPTSRPD